MQARIQSNSEKVDPQNHVFQLIVTDQINSPLPMRHADRRRSPAHRALEICWAKCLPKNRYKYLQGSEILGLIRELESFFQVPRLLEPDEDGLLRSTLAQKPQLRLFKGESVSFLLGLVHFSSVEAFLETRFRISPERLSKMVEFYDTGYSGNKSKDSTYERADLASAWPKYDRSKDTGAYSAYSSKSHDFLRTDGDSRWKSNPGSAADTSSSVGSWFPKWSRESGGQNVRFEGDQNAPKTARKEESETWGSWARRKKSQAMHRMFGKRASDPIFEKTTGPERNTFSDFSDWPTKTPIKAEPTPAERKFQAVKESLADVRAQSNRLEAQARLSPGESVAESLDKLQAAVCDQARVIARLERERARDFRTSAPGVVAKMYVPWDYFTNFVSTFISDLLEELLPHRQFRSIPELVIRVVSIVLGYFALLNFFKLVYFLAVLSVCSSDSALPYIFSDEEAKESAPLTWLQVFPTLEYWSYQLRDWTGY